MLRLTPRLSLYALAAASVAALAGAFVAQYGFHLFPCHLCLLQRWPYGGVIIIGVLAHPLPAKYMRPLLLLCGALLVVDAGIAFYHAGVEQHWFPGPTSCTSQGGADSIAALRAQILGAPIVMCDQSQVDIKGVTLAGANAVYAALLAAFAFWRTLRKPQ